MLTAEREQQVIGLCQTLIQKQSYSGQEDGVVDRIKKAFRELGYDEVSVDNYGNVLGRIRGKRPGKVILLDGHIDTVPVPDESKWKHKPFSGQLEDGKIYGRGTSDMKGAVASMIAASAFFAADTDKNFAGEIYVSGVVHEECFEGIAARKISERVKPDYVVIGEASELNLKRGQRGRAEVVVETFGKPAHSANPHKGINAVYKMASLIRAISELEAPTHPTLGLGILELTDIKSSPYPGASVVPDYCRATYDRRLLSPDGFSKKATSSFSPHWQDCEAPASLRRSLSIRSAPTAVTTQAKQRSRPSVSDPHEKTSRTPSTNTLRSISY